MRRSVGRFGAGVTKPISSRRDIAMLPNVEAAIGAQRKASGLRGPWVFSNDARRPLNLSNFDSVCGIRRRARLRARSLYQTRHTFVVLMLAAGEAPVWSVEMIFRRYYRFIPNLTRPDGSAAARRLQQERL